MEINEIHAFLKGINKDISEESMPNDMARDAMNVIIGSSKDGELSLIRNIRSNIKLDYQYELPTGDNEAIGSVEYPKEKAVIEFVKNSNNNHEIRLIQNDEVYLVTRGSYLNFNNRIKAVVYGDYLAWTDNENEVRLLNIQWAKNYTAVMLEYGTGLTFVNQEIKNFFDGIGAVGSFFEYNGVIYRVKALPTGIAKYIPPNTSYYTAIGSLTSEMYRFLDNDTITLIPKPPTSLPVATYFTDLNYNMNNLYGDIYRFSYRHVYKDYRRSVWSHLSNIALPHGSDDMVVQADIINNNAINIDLDTGNHDVIEIELGFVKASNRESFNIISTIKKYDKDGNIIIPSNSIYTFASFYNNEQYIAQPIESLYKAFDFVPNTSNNIGILSDGRIILADNETGLDDVEPDVSYETDSSDVLLEASSLTESNSGALTVTEDSSVDWVLYKLSYGANGYNDNYKVTINLAVTTASVTENYPLEFLLPYDKNKTDDANLETAVLTIRNQILGVYLRRFITGSGSIHCYVSSLKPVSAYFTTACEKCDIYGAKPYAATIPSTYAGGDSFYLLKEFIAYSGNIPLGIVNLNITSFVIDGSLIKQATSLKHSSKFNVGILYYDAALKHGSIQAKGSVSVEDMPSFTCSLANGYKYPSLVLKATINHQPPEDARYYKFVVTEHNYSDYIQGMIKSVSFPVTIGGVDYYKIDFNSYISEDYERNENIITQTWVFEKGDRIRFLATIDSLTSFKYNTLFDCEIIKQEDGVNEFYVLKDSSFTPVRDMIIEVYRPKKGVSSDYELYFDTGDIYEIGDAGLSTRYHKGILDADTDQVAGTTPAVIYPNYYNTYLRLNITKIDTAFTGDAYNVLESKNFSIFYNSDFYNTGRPVNMAIDLSKKRRDTHLCFGGKIDITAKQNNVGTFDYDDYAELNSSFGEITGIGQIGYTLHVIQANKFTSFYIATSVVKEADGGEQILISEKILNNKQVSEFDYGTIHPDSVIVRNTHILLFDATRGAFTRIAKNGAFEISNYGIDSLSKELAQISRTADEFNIMGAYDEGNDMYIWFWYYTIGLNTFSGSASFRDGDNSWRGGFDFTKAGVPIEWMSKYQDRIITFLEGDAWLHEETSADNKTHNNWYAEDKESYIEFVFNKDPKTNKVLRNMKLKSEYEWLPDTDGDILVDYNSDKMTSMILLSKKVENLFLLTFKRNTSTKQAGTAIQKLNYGETLRGCHANIKLRTSSNVRNRLYSVSVFSTASEPLM